ncbi:MAG: hypothetical protein AAGF31_12490, partial [Planctomycetota bacterium]
MAPLQVYAVESAELAADISTLSLASGVKPTAPNLQAAWQRLAEGEPEVLVELLAAMRDADLTVENWLRTCFDAAAERLLAEGTLPVDPLKKFMRDDDQSPNARQTAFEWITRANPDEKPALLEQMLDDPSLALRYDAIAQLIERAEAADEDAAKLEIYKQALKSARDPGQLNDIADALEGLGEEIDLAAEMGFLTKW